MEIKFKIELVYRLIIEVLLGIFLVRHFISGIIVMVLGIFGSYLQFIATCILVYSSRLLDGFSYFLASYNL